MAAGSAELGLALERTLKYFVCKMAFGVMLFSGRRPPGHCPTETTPSGHYNNKHNPPHFCTLHAPRGAALYCAHACVHPRPLLLPNQCEHPASQQESRERGLKAQNPSFTRAGDISIEESFKNITAHCRGAADPALRELHPSSPSHHPGDAPSPPAGHFGDGFVIKSGFPAAAPSCWSLRRGWRLAGLAGARFDRD